VSERSEVETVLAEFHDDVAMVIEIIRLRGLVDGAVKRDPLRVAYWGIYLQCGHVAHPHDAVPFREVERFIARWNGTPIYCNEGCASSVPTGEITEMPKGWVPIPRAKVLPVIEEPGR